ncbi:hypothetical protein [Labrys wisconsinensis]|uniref:Uncharacterized protein n=1 Tax=Labrys wisconsinensis TaxID=425677 RepID=A0ABU0JHX2_9HYPH|nr:hypothetical protein [Labrys wisconsinensis]MDQ0472844.1 hypothetical protein [Labrys wisconsinensis]
MMLSPVEQRRRAEVRDELGEQAQKLADAYVQSAGGDVDKAMLRLAKVATLLTAEIGAYREGRMTPQLSRVFEDQRRQVR